MYLCVTYMYMYTLHVLIRLRLIYYTCVSKVKEYYYTDKDNYVTSL